MRSDKKIRPGSGHIHAAAPGLLSAVYTLDNPEPACPVLTVFNVFGLVFSSVSRYPVVFFDGPVRGEESCFRDIHQRAAGPCKGSCGVICHCLLFADNIGVEVRKCLEPVFY